MIHTSFRTKIVLVNYLFYSTVDFVLGLRYVTATEFMPYHSEALNARWQELESPVQTLLLALMKVAGAGWVVLGFVTITLALAAFKSGSIALRWTLPIARLIFYSVSFAATWSVHQATGASTPWGSSALMIGLAILVLVIDAPWSSRDRAHR